VETGDVVRTTDAAYVNAVANHPAVRPHIGASAAGELDFGPIAANPANILLKLDHGLMMFIPVGDQTYELHTLLLPEGRGAKVLPAAASAFDYMFAHGCDALTTYTPASNRPAALMARRAGFVQTGVRIAAWEDGSDITDFRLSRDHWIARRSEAH
jgi:hypothetical protein